MRFIKEKDKKQIGRLNLFGAGGLLMFNFLIYIIILRRATAASFSSAGRCFLFYFLLPFYLLLPYLARVREVFAHYVKHSDHRIVYIRDIACNSLDSGYV